MVVMPGARWGEKRDRTFPENAFNPTWSPHVPTVGPAFAEIAVTWETEFQFACLEELVKRVGSHLGRLGGGTVDVEAAKLTLHKAEDAVVANATKVQPTEVNLKWDWETKQFDVFLSHKITDAKDIVLTWYNALSALGYNPFLDRLSLDAVEKIPEYVTNTVTFAIAVTANLWQSYWCAVELLTAADVHMEGKLNIILIPIQGERFKVPDSEQELDFPTPEIMMQNYAKWFPKPEQLKPNTRETVLKLYGGGEFTQARLVKHTLMHYKSFERLFIARCGSSIASVKAVRALVAQGGATVGQQASAIMPLVAEANGIRQQKGRLERFEARLVPTKSVLGYSNSDENSSALHVVELLHTEEGASPVELRTYSAQAFSEVVRGMRAQSNAMGVGATKVSAALETWMVLDASNASAGEEMGRLLGEALKPMQETWKVLVGFMQVIGSFFSSLPSVVWPTAFLSFGDLFGWFSFDFVSFEFINTNINGGIDYCNTTLGMNISFACFLVALPTTLPFYRRLSDARREALEDRAVWLAVVMAFVLYPVLSMRLLKVFSERTFGTYTVLQADWRLQTKDLLYCQAGGATFLVVYTLGIPFLFWRILLHAARPATAAIDFSQADAADRLDFERRQLARFGVLYAKYEPQCWWWELVELSRKLVLTGAVLFIKPGYVTQIWFTIMLALVFLLIMTYFTPFKDPRIDAIAFTSQLCTVLTLIVSLGLDANAFPNVWTEGVISRDMLAAALLVFSIVPLALGLGLFLWAAHDALRMLRVRRPPRVKLPLALRDESPDEEEKNARTSSARLEAFNLRIERWRSRFTLRRNSSSWV